MKILPPVSIEARRLLPSRWDLLAAVLVMGFLVAFADVSRFLVHPLSSISGDYLKLDPWDLPGYALRTSLRMLIALGVSLAFTFSYATWAAKNPRAGTLLVPLLDILQSIPILSFLSLTIVWFLSLSPGRILGAELACVFVIFTGQAWNMAFSFYQSLAHRAAGTGGSRPHVRPQRLGALLADRGALRHAVPDLEHDDEHVGRLVLRHRVRGHQCGQDQYRAAGHRQLDRGRHRPAEPARHLRGHRGDAGGDPDL